MTLYIPASRIAACIALLALMPMIVLAACLWFVAPAWQAQFAGLLVGYAALILAFTGGIHWGEAFKGSNLPSDLWRYLYGVMPAVLAWVVLMCPPQQALFLLFLGFVFGFYIDRMVYSRETIAFRTVITGVTCISLYAAYKAL